MRLPRINKFRVLYLAVGLGFYVLFLIFTLPAAWVARGFEQATQGAATLASPSGTFWRGHGELSVRASGTVPQYIGDLNWAVNPFWLVTGRVQIRLRAAGPATEAKAVIRVARKSMRILDLTAALPVNLTSLFYAPIGFFGPTGQVRLSTTSLELDSSGLQGDAQVLWENAGGRFTTVAPLGDYRLDLNGRGEQATLKLSTLRGPLELTGQGQWRVLGTGDIRFTGFAAPKAEQQQLEPLLSTMGKDLGGGRRQINLSGRAPLNKLVGL